jgi:hypothetical protein
MSKARFDRPARERPVCEVPLCLRVALVVAMLMQLALSALQPAPSARAEALPQPPSAQLLRVSSLGDPVPFAQVLVLYLQAFDNQPGVSIPFAQLDYEKVEAWLSRILALDPSGQYPLLLASQVYAQVPDPARQRRMLDLVYRSFLEDPAQRWRWLAHAAIMARHRLQDPHLALTYAKALREHTRADEIPGWARQLEIFIYEDMGQYQSAKVLLGGLLDSGAVTDPHEQRFLIERLRQIESAEKSSGASKRRLPLQTPSPAPLPDSNPTINQ